MRIEFDTIRNEEDGSLRKEVEISIHDDLTGEAFRSWILFSKLKAIVERIEKQYNEHPRKL